MMHKLLITDLDDTLYDWSGFFVPAFYAMAEEIAGITGIAMDQLLHEYREVHQSLGTVEFPYATLRLPSIRACFTGMETAQMKEALRPAFMKFNGIRDSRLRLFPGVAETLEALAARGLTIIGYTESSQENGFYRLQKLGADRFFKRVYACESQFQSTYGSNEKVRTVRTKKPNVDVLLDICRKEGRTPAEVAYVGDSLTKDMYMAKKAGVTALWARYPREDTDYYEKLCAITSWTQEDFEREERLRRHMEQADLKPDHILTSFSQLPGILFPGKEY